MIHSVFCKCLHCGEIKNNRSSIFFWFISKNFNPNISVAEDVSDLGMLNQSNAVWKNTEIKYKVISWSEHGLYYLFTAIVYFDNSIVPLEHVISTHLSLLLLVPEVDWSFVKQRIIWLVANIIKKGVILRTTDQLFSEKIKNGRLKQ